MPTTTNLLIKEILATAAAKNASDIHLTVGNSPFLRINGLLTVMTESEIIKPEVLEEIVDFFLNKDQKVKLLADKEITLVYYNEEASLRYRLNVFFQKGYPMISLRLIPAVIPDFSNLGLPKVIADFCENRRGLIIISGPFNSGRTTVLASLIQLINLKRAEHIITLEKPIEYLFVNEKSIIEQREVGKDVDSFEKGLTTILDEDVNIVAVSEVTSSEILESVLELAESGRLVFLIMNSDSVVSTLEKFIAGFKGEKKIWALNVLSDLLIGILILRFLPKITSGMVFAYEILTMTSAVMASIKEGKLYQLSSILQTSRAEGMINLDKSLLELVKKDQITKETALREALEKESFKNSLRNLSR